MNKLVKSKIYITLDNLYDELDKCYTIKDNLRPAAPIGERVTNETRIKLIRDFINLFKMARRREKPDLEMYIRIRKRYTLHMYQLKKMGTECPVINDNKLYFMSLLKVALGLRDFKC